MKVMNEWETVAYLLDTKSGISRYGDGELKLCTGRSAKSQKWNPQIQSRLQLILKSPILHHLVGIPRIENRNDFPTEEKAKFWNRYDRGIYHHLYHPFLTYGSSFITRPDTSAAIDCPAFFIEIKKLWEGRRVLVVQGTGTGFLKDPELLSGCENYRVIHGPKRDAFSEYDAMFRLIQSNLPTDGIVLLSLGPTATILAYDLAKEGILALDLGHLGQFYGKVHPKSTGTNYE